MTDVSDESVTIFGNIRILIEICLNVSVQFVFELISGYISSFFFVFLIFLIEFLLYILKFAIFAV